MNDSRVEQAYRLARERFSELGVDTENLSGALRVYERVGFKPVKRFLQFEKKLA
jgi:ribosomal protein S18 acetylase RimI-like enzyme